MTEMIGDGRPIRVCDLCGGVDDHPRHVIAGSIEDVWPVPAEDILQRVVQHAAKYDLTTNARLLRDLLDTRSTDRHLDCCRQAGCPDGTCNTQTAGAEDKRGAQLMEHLMSKVEDAR